MNKLPHFFILITILFALVVIGCNTTKDTNNPSACKTNGTVEDLTGLDGCGLLIVLENGDKYLPTTNDFEGKTLAAGQKISFGYKEAEAMASICMAESKIVELTCLTILAENPIPEKIPCLDITKPMEIEWMAKAIKSHQPKTITKYAYRTDGWAYILKGKEVHMYDCQGTLVCSDESGDIAPCAKLTMPGATGALIWEAN